jgi:hypothetical protein
MVVHNFDIIGVAVAPRETDSPLNIDTDAVLALAIAVKRFKPVTRRGKPSPAILLRCPTGVISFLQSAQLSRIA